MTIESIRFQNFKALRDATLPLGRCTILVGANGTGKSTVLQGLEALRDPNTVKYEPTLSVGTSPKPDPQITLTVQPEERQEPYTVNWKWNPVRVPGRVIPYGVTVISHGETMPEALESTRVFSFDSTAIAADVAVSEKPRLEPDGTGLAAVLDSLRDDVPECFEAINKELGRWLPEFDRILFERPEGGKKAISLRTRQGQHKIPASGLSQGTLISLAILTLAYLPEPPLLVGLEEPDRGIHPRLLRRVRDAIYRLSHPESCGEDREPVQVIATTHSPYFLDLFKDHPEEIVIAEKTGTDVQFKRLSDMPNIKEILADAPLGEVWYTGILGGVPSQP